MNKYLIRFVALLLVPCLIADPATVSAFTNTLAPVRGGVGSIAFRQNRFEEDAFAMIPLWMRKARQPAFTERIAAATAGGWLVRSGHILTHKVQTSIHWHPRSADFGLMLLITGFSVLFFRLRRYQEIVKFKGDAFQLYRLAEKSKDKNTPFNFQHRRYGTDPLQVDAESKEIDQKAKSATSIPVWFGNAGALVFSLGISVWNRSLNPWAIAPDVITGIGLLLMGSALFSYAYWRWIPNALHKELEKIRSEKADNVSPAPASEKIVAMVEAPWTQGSNILTLRNWAHEHPLIFVEYKDNRPDEILRLRRPTVHGGDVIRVTRPKDPVTKAYPIHLDLVKRIIRLEEPAPSPGSPSLKTMHTTKDAPWVDYEQTILTDPSLWEIRVKIDDEPNWVKPDGPKGALNNLFYKSIFALKMQSSGTAIQDLVRQILNQNSGEIILQVSDRLPVNAARVIRPDGKTIIVLNARFVRDLMRLEKKFPRVVAWLLAERLFHELGHTNKMDIVPLELLEEVDRVYQDALLQIHAVQSTPLETQIEDFFNTQRNLLRFHSGSYFGMDGLVGHAVFLLNSGKDESYVKEWIESQLQPIYDLHPYPISALGQLLQHVHVRSWLKLMPEHHSDKSAPVSADAPVFVDPFEDQGLLEELIPHMLGFTFAKVLKRSLTEVQQELDVATEKNLELFLDAYRPGGKVLVNDKRQTYDPTNHEDALKELHGVITRAMQDAIRVTVEGYPDHVAVLSNPARKNYGSLVKVARDAAWSAGISAYSQWISRHDVPKTTRENTQNWGEPGQDYASLRRQVSMAAEEFQGPALWLLEQLEFYSVLPAYIYIKTEAQSISLTTGLKDPQGSLKQFFKIKLVSIKHAPPKPAQYRVESLLSGKAGLYDDTNSSEAILLLLQGQLRGIKNYPEWNKLLVAISSTAGRPKRPVTPNATPVPVEKLKVPSKKRSKAFILYKTVEAMASYFLADADVHSLISSSSRFNRSRDGGSVNIFIKHPGGSQGEPLHDFRIVIHRPHNVIVQKVSQESIIFEKKYHSSDGESTVNAVLEDLQNDLDWQDLVRDVKVSLDAPKPPLRHVSYRERAFYMAKTNWFRLVGAYNAWMDMKNQPNINNSDKQSLGLINTLKQMSARVMEDFARKEVPDMVFTANAGLTVVIDGQPVFIPSRFSPDKRKPEIPIFINYFKRKGYRIVDTLFDTDEHWEGEGDMLEHQGTLFGGWGFRSDPSAHTKVAEYLGMKLVLLRLVDPRFYHVDTALAFLDKNTAIYYPGAFDAESREALEEHMRGEGKELIAVDEADAKLFACNAVVFNHHVVMNEVSDALTQRLEKRGFIVHRIPLSEFPLSGGAAKCLVLNTPAFEVTTSAASASRDESNDRRTHPMSTGAKGPVGHTLDLYSQPIQDMLPPSLYPRMVNAVGPYFDIEDRMTLRRLLQKLQDRPVLEGIYSEIMDHLLILAIEWRAFKFLTWEEARNFSKFFQLHPASSMGGDFTLPEETALNSKGNYVLQRVHHPDTPDYFHLSIQKQNKSLREVEIVIHPGVDHPFSGSPDHLRYIEMALERAAESHAQAAGVTTDYFLAQLVRRYGDRLFLEFRDGQSQPELDFKGEKPIIVIPLDRIQDGPFKLISDRVSRLGFDFISELGHLADPEGTDPELEPQFLKIAISSLGLNNLLRISAPYTSRSQFAQQLVATIQRFQRERFWYQGTRLLASGRAPKFYPHIAHVFVEGRTIWWKRWINFFLKPFRGPPGYPDKYSDQIFQGLWGPHGAIAKESTTPSILLPTGKRIERKTHPTSNSSPDPAKSASAPQAQNSPDADTVKSILAEFQQGKIGPKKTMVRLASLLDLPTTGNRLGEVFATVRGLRKVSTTTTKKLTSPLVPEGHGKSLPKLSQLSDSDLRGKRVLVRVDLNVLDPKGNPLASDARIRKALPTIGYLRERGAKVILVSHAQRPEGRVVEKYRLDPVQDQLSTALKIPILKLNQWTGPEVQAAVDQMQSGDVILLENIRFDPREESKDPAIRQALARELAAFTDIYVNDAFDTAHRAHASTAEIVRFAPRSVAGLSLMKDILQGDRALQLLEGASHPIVAIFGGAKVKDKLPLIKTLLGQRMRGGDVLLIGGLMAKDFRADIVKEAQAKGVTVLLATDAVAGGHDIGPKTIAAFQGKIAQAKTILWNGPVGIYEQENSAAGTRAIARAIAEATKWEAVTIPLGGDTVAATEKTGLTDKDFTLRVTGGGAMLKYLAFNGKLPAIEALSAAPAPAGMIGGTPEATRVFAATEKYHEAVENFEKLSEQYRHFSDTEDPEARSLRVLIVVAQVQMEEADDELREALDQVAIKQQHHFIPMIEMFLEDLITGKLPKTVKALMQRGGVQKDAYHWLMKHQDGGVLLDLVNLKKVDYDAFKHAIPLIELHEILLCEMWLAFRNVRGLMKGLTREEREQFVQKNKPWLMGLADTAAIFVHQTRNSHFENGIAGMISGGSPEGAAPEPIRIYRPFGKTGLKFFILGLGTIWLGRQWPPKNTAYTDPTEEEIQKYLEQAFALMSNKEGILMLDTAAAYGKSEERLGHMLRQRADLATRTFIATKWGEEYNVSTGESKFDYSAENLRHSLERSEQHLGKIDLLYIHMPSQVTADILRDSAVRGEMEKIRAAGRVHFLGASISNEKTLEEAVRGKLLYGLDVIQMPTPVFLKRPDLVQQIHQDGLAIVLNSPVRTAEGQEPANIYRDLAGHPEVSVILTGTRTHLAETVGYFTPERIQASATPAPKKPVVVIAEDEPDMQQQITDRDLKPWRKDYDFVVVGNGEDAWTQIQEKYSNVALLVTDVEMPGRGGLLLVEDVSERYPHIPIIIHTNASTAPIELLFKGNDKVHVVSKKEMGALFNKAKELLPAPAPNDSVQRRTISIEGTVGTIPVEIVRKMGTHKVVLVAHGLSGSLKSALPQKVAGLANLNASVVTFTSSRYDINSSGWEEDTLRRMFKGKTYEQDLEDVRRVIRYVTQNAEELFGTSPDALEIYLVGTSMGAISSILLSTEFPVSGIVAINSGVRFWEGNRQRPDIPLVRGFPPQDRVQSALSGIKKSLLVVRGEKDGVITREAAQDLAQLASNRGIYREIPNMAHSLGPTSSPPQAVQELMEAIRIFVNAGGNPMSESPMTPRRLKVVKESGYQYGGDAFTVYELEPDALVSLQDLLPENETSHLEGPISLITVKGPAAPYELTYALEVQGGPIRSGDKYQIARVVSRDLSDHPLIRIPDAKMSIALYSENQIQLFPLDKPHQAAPVPANVPTLEGVVRWNEVDYSKLKKPVLVAVNLDVVKGGKIKDETKIDEALKELDSIEVPMVFVSHNGRPQKDGRVGLSLESAANAIEKKWRGKKNIIRGKGLTGAEVVNQIRALKPNDVLVLENFRFDERAESDAVADRKALAHDIVYGDEKETLFSMFINNDFASTHRDEPPSPSTRLVDFTELLPSVAGPLLINELQQLEPARAVAAHPFVQIVGGAKVGDKIKIIVNSLEKMARGDILVIGGMMAYTFLAVEAELDNQPIHLGGSADAVETKFIAQVKNILETAREKGVQVILPSDHVITDNVKAAKTVETTQGKDIPAGFVGADIGPETVKRIREVIKGAKLIFWNGPVGAFDLDKRFENGTIAIAQELATAQSAGIDVISGGGDTLKATAMAGVKGRFKHESTGGGSSLQVVALRDGEDLAPVAALKRTAAATRAALPMKTAPAAPAPGGPTYNLDVTTVLTSLALVYAVSWGIAKIAVALQLPPQLALLMALSVPVVAGLYAMKYITPVLLRTGNKPQKPAVSRLNLTLHAA